MTTGVRVDELPAGSALVGTEAIPGMVSGIAYKWTPAQFTTYVRASMATVTVTKGGTGIDYTIPAGSLLRGSGGSALVDLDIGTTHQVLTVDEAFGMPAWQNPRIPQVTKSANYTFVLTDGGKHYLHPSADTTTRTWTIPANSTVAFPIGTTLTFINQNSAGVLTIAINTDTMRLSPDGTAGSRTLAANGIATAIKITTTEWIIAGSGLT